LFHYTGWKTHNLHHQSWATSAVSSYYMTVIDYTAEHMSVFVPMVVWRQVGPHWPIVIALATWHVIATHSGWDLMIGPDPKDHFIHHNVNVNYNLGIFFDQVFGTFMSWQSCKPEYFVFDKYSTGEDLKGKNEAEKAEKAEEVEKAEEAESVEQVN